MFEIAGEPQIVRDTRKKILDTFADLEFEEEGHIYTLHGKTLNSVSGIGHRFESRPFDKECQAARYAIRHGGTAEYWLAEWAKNSFRATSLGTKTHEFGESMSYWKNGLPELILPRIMPQYNKEYNYLAPIHPKEEAVVAFFDKLPSSYHLVLNEAKVYSGLNPDPSKNLKEQICGTFDMLYYYDGDGDPSRAGFVVLDYKTNGDLYCEYNQRNGIMLKYPFEEIVQEDLGLYTIQLSLYSLMLEDIGINVIRRALIWLKPDGTYEAKAVKDVSARLREVL